MNFEIYDKIIDIQKNRLIEEFKKKYKSLENFEDYKTASKALGEFDDVPF